MPTKNSYLLGLDVGDKRIGVALASPVALIASPLMVLQHTNEIWVELEELIKAENIGTVVVGLPRSLDGNETAQTKSAQKFANTIRDKFKIEVVMQDEALTSRQAEAELRGRGKQFSKGDIDALAATYILEDYLRTYNSNVSGS